MPVLWGTQGTPPSLSPAPARGLQIGPEGGTLEVNLEGELRELLSPYHPGVPT